jgi:hypothetical protein
MKAMWNNAALAESDETTAVEGNHYFPPDFVTYEYLRESDHHTTCFWKGRASYYDVVVDGEVNAEALARGVIEKVGSGRHFLQEDHTLRHFRQELWMPSLLTRQHYAVWQEAGAKDMAQRVRERVREIVEGHEAPPLPDETVAALEKLRCRGEEELIGR